MRPLVRLLGAHVIATWIEQLILIVWLLAAAQRINPARGAIAMVFAPILIPVMLLRIGPRSPVIPFAVHWLLYIALLVVAFALLRWRAARR